MKNVASDNFYHIGRSVQLLEDMYDIRVDLHKARELAVRVYHNAKPVKVVNYLFRARIKDYKVELPCESFVIKAVLRTDVINNFFGVNRSQTMLILREGFKDRTVVKEVRGNVTNANPDAIQILRDWDFVDKIPMETPLQINEDLPVLYEPHNFFENYSLDGNTLTFNRTDTDVDVIYRTLLTDEEGFPYFSEKGILAVVDYLAYLDQLKKFYRKEGNENAVMLAKDNYERLVAQARSPENMTDNQADELFRTLLSKSRQFYGAPMRGY